MRRPFVILTLAIGLLASAYGALVLVDLAARTESRSTRPLPVGERLRLETGSGDIEVSAGDGPARVELRTVGGLWGEPKVTIRRDAGGRVDVDADCPGPFSFFCSVEASVRVPPRTALVARTGSGSVEVRGLRGGVDAETGSGDVELTGVGGDRILADTGSGDVEATLVDPPRDLIADTGSGDVELRLPDAGYAIDADTGSGEERIDVRRDADSPRRIRIDTGSGDVSVRPAR